MADIQLHNNDINHIVFNLKRLFDTDGNVVFALIFGSYAAGTYKKGSDVDIAVYFTAPPQGMALLSLINRIANQINKDVDLVVLNCASAFVRHQVMKNRITIVIKDHLIYRKFREKTLSDYDEYKFISGMSIYDK
jgi:predicted nucleotidyltransferase